MPDLTPDSDVAPDVNSMHLEHRRREIKVNRHHLTHCSRPLQQEPCSRRGGEPSTASILAIRGGFTERLLWPIATWQTSAFASLNGPSAKSQRLGLRKLEVVGDDRIGHRRMRSAGLAAKHLTLRVEAPLLAVNPPSTRIHVFTVAGRLLV